MPNTYLAYHCIKVWRERALFLDGRVLRGGQGARGRVRRAGVDAEERRLFGRVSERMDGCQECAGANWNRGEGQDGSDH